MKRNIFLLVLTFITLTSLAQKKTKTENIVLITLDGMRWQEIFSGAEKRLITSEFTGDSAGIVRDFWADTPERRRELMMPFMWTTVAKKGQLFGNRAYNNFVNVTNKQWFSYPGYSELLCGFADDSRINSNDKFNNPNKTVLDFINSQAAYKGKIMAYTSWDVFPYIINTERNGIKVNSGLLPAKTPNEREKLLNRLMREVANPLGDVRLDAFTFNYGFEDFKRSKPNFLYLSFDETDDFAHGGKYDLYLRSANATDDMIRELWEYCQATPQYKDKTTFIITCDHGRGKESKDDWRHHGIKMPNADQIWIAVIGPDTAGTGEQKTAGQLYQAQIAKTMAALLGLNYTGEGKAGETIQAIVHP